MQWLSNLLGRKPRELQHPSGPAVSPTGVPKTYMEYFVDDKPDKDGMYAWFARVYYPVPSGEGWVMRTSEKHGVTKMYARSRADAQRWGNAEIVSRKPGDVK